MSKQISKVLISDAVDESCVSLLESRGCCVDNRPSLTPEELRQCVAGYQGLIVRSATKVTADVIAAAPVLRVVGRAGTGVDNIDLAAASSHGIAVLNSPGGNTISAAEQTFALMIALARQIGAAYVSMREECWQRSRFSGVELYGKTLGVVGLGQIGKEVAKRALAFGMRVVAFDPVLSSEDFSAVGVEQLDFEALVRNSHFITLHVPLNDHTRGLISHRQFAICRQDLRLINVCRGGVVDEDALYEALTSGRIAGAALDVFSSEPPSDYRFSKLDNVITTPHLGASTIDAQKRIAVEIAATVADYLHGERVSNIVNADELHI